LRFKDATSGYLPKLINVHNPEKFEVKLIIVTCITSSFTRKPRRCLSKNPIWPK